MTEQAKAGLCNDTKKGELKDVSRWVAGQVGYVVDRCAAWPRTPARVNTQLIAL